jgi:hypothetical protein
VRAETVLPLPHWTILDASNITLKLKSHQATRSFFCDLAAMLASIADAAADPGVPQWLICRWKHAGRLMHPAPACLELYLRYTYMLSVSRYD